MSFRVRYISQLAHERVVYFDIMKEVFRFKGKSSARVRRVKWTASEYCQVIPHDWNNKKLG